MASPYLPVHALYSHVVAALATALGSSWRRSGQHPQLLDEQVSAPETTRLWSMSVDSSTWADEGSQRQRDPSGARTQTAIRVSFLRRVRSDDAAGTDYVSALQDEQTVINAMLAITRQVTGHGPIQALLWTATPARSPVPTDSTVTVQKVDLDFVAVHLVPLAAGL